MFVAQKAKAIGVNPRTLQRWFNLDCPNGTVEEIAAWREANMRRPIWQDSEKSELRREKLAAKTAKLEADAAMKRLRLVQLSDELVPIGEGIAEHAEFVAFAHKVLQDLPRNISGQITPPLRKRVESVSQAAVDRFIRKLASWEPTCPQPIDEDETGEAEAE